MNNTNLTIVKTGGMSKLERAKFQPGMLLLHEDMQQLNDYTRDLSRLLFKSFFGCGVICGLAVKVDPKCGKVCITVGAGVALACSGDPVQVPQDQTLTLDENCDSNIAGPLWVVLCGTVKQCAPRNSMCASDDDEAPAEPTRERDGFEIRVVRLRPECVCSCKEPNKRKQDIKLLIDADCKCVNPELECYEDHYNGKCGCCCDDCSNCACECILLARLENKGSQEDPKWTTDHSVRRFIRPILMRDPQVEIEVGARKVAEEKKQYASMLEVLDQDRAEAYRLADDAATEADKVVFKANMAVAYKESKVAATRAVRLQLNEVQAEAERTAVQAKAAADKLAKVEAGKATGNKTATAKAEVETTAALEKAVGIKLARSQAELEKAVADEAKAVADADAAEAEARKAEENRANAYRTAAGAADRAARLMKEKTPPAERQIE